MKTYQEIKQENAKAVNEFKGLFFAFNNDQFKEGMEKIGITIKDTSLIYAMGAGCYILKTRAKAFSDMIKTNRQRLKTLKDNEKELIKAIAYELSNHEYCISGDVEPALNALNLAIENVNNEVLKKAIKLSLDNVC